MKEIHLPATKSVVNGCKNQRLIIMYCFCRVNYKANMQTIVLKHQNNVNNVKFTIKMLLNQEYFSLLLDQIFITKKREKVKAPYRLKYFATIISFK